MQASDQMAAQDRVARWLVMGALALSLPLAVLFVGWSHIDIWVAAQSYAGNRDFSGHLVWWSEPLRFSFQVFYVACLALAAIGLWRTLRGASWLRRPRVSWLYLLGCLMIGPLLVTHGLFKSPFGRPRPMEIAEFGGTKTFKPAFVPSGQCTWGCSFVSGETASTFIPFLAAAVLAPHTAPLLIIGGTAVGLTAGSIRMFQGRHFLSDVVFAGLLMALVAGLTLPLARRVDRAIDART